MQHEELKERRSVTWKTSFIAPTSSISPNSLNLRHKNTFQLNLIETLSVQCLFFKHSLPSKTIYNATTICRLQLFEEKVAYRT